MAGWPNNSRTVVTTRKGDWADRTHNSHRHHADDEPAEERSNTEVRKPYRAGDKHRTQSGHHYGPADAD